MHKTWKSVTRRGLSLLLVAVMMIGMLPLTSVTPVLAAGTGGATGTTNPITDSDGLDWTTAKANGRFIRFTLIEIQRPDDTTTDVAGHEGNVDHGLNPHAGDKAFLYGSEGMAVDESNYKTIGSVNIGTTGSQPVVSGATWYNTNALGYRLVCEKTTDAASRKAAVFDYAKNNQTTAPNYYSWNDWLAAHPDSSGATLADFVESAAGHDIFSEAFAWGNYNVGGDNDSNFSWSNFSYDLLKEIMGKPHTAIAGEKDEYHTIRNSLMANGAGMDIPWVFDFNDEVTYRIIAEPGWVIKKSGYSEYFAVTARDCAAIAIDTPKFVIDQNTPYRNACTGLADKYTHPYGWYAERDESQPANISDGYKLKTVDNIKGALWSPGSGTSLYASGARYQLFGLTSNGNGLADGGGGSPYPALGMAVLGPMKFDIATKGLKISKTVTNTGDGYTDMEWQFTVELNGSGGAGGGAGGGEAEIMLTAGAGGTGGAGSGGIKVIQGDGTEQSFDSIDALQVFLANPITLKTGQVFTIEGLPEGTTYTVKEITDGLTPTDPDSEGWKIYVTDSGASDTSERDVTDTGETNGTMPESGIANVSFKNTEAGGLAHLIVDYNLPRATATFDDKTGTILSSNVVKCGTHPVGDEVVIAAAFNGQTLEPNSTEIQIGTVTVNGTSVPVKAKFLGLFQSPDGDSPLAYEGGGKFKYRLAHEDLTVIYACWDVGGSGGGGPIPIEPGEGGLYTVFWDYNYDGGGVTSSLAGKYVYDGEATFQCSCDGGSGTYHFELPMIFSYPDPPVREGFSFEGWSLDPTATTGTLNPTDPGHFDTYYGTWMTKETQYKANGGVFSNGNDTMVIGQKPHARGNFIPVLEEEPTRIGYTFNGWYLDEECSQPLEGYEEGVQPGRTYYAGWTAEKVKVTYYDVREGTHMVHEQTYNYNDLFDVLEGMKNTAGWHWVTWELKDGTDVVPKDGTNLTQDFPLEYHKYYGDGSSPETAPPEDGRDPSLMSDAGYWTLDIYAKWEEQKTPYTLELVWNDIENNDGCRPKTITVGVVDSYMNNQVIATETVDVEDTATSKVYTVFEDLTVQDNDASLQKRQYDLVFLGYTDCRGTPYTMKSPAIDGDRGVIDLQTISTGSDATLTQYTYGVNNYSRGDGSNPGATTGFTPGEYHTIITFDHALIDTGDDIKFTIDWDDDGDNDGKRPGSVMLVLYADGVPVYERPWENHKFGKDSVSAGLCEVTNDGNTWTYIFPEYQRYHDGQAIQYTVAIKNNDNLHQTFDKDEYQVEYLNPVSEEAGSPDGCIIHRAVHMEDVPVKIIWDDENNRDGQRPEYVTVALMANQWNDHTFRWEHEEIATQVIRANEDARNTMTASEWYGSFGSQKVYNDGLRRIYHLVVLSDLNQFIPEGSFQYGWTEDSYGNQRLTAEDYVNIQRRNPVAQVRIGQNTNTVSVTGNIYWDDSQNNDNIRPVNVVMQLYSHAPGQTPEPVVGEAYRVTLTGDPTADNWYYTFSGMPKYAEGQSGVELVYTVKIEEVDGEPLYGYYIITANGEQEEVLRYEASYLYENPDGMTAEGDTLNTLDFNKSDRAYVRLRHVCETKTMNFSVNWHDGDNRDNVRPVNVMAELYKTIGNGEPIYIETIDISAGRADMWTYRITGLAGYEDTQPVEYTLKVSEDVRAQLAAIGYTVSVEDNIYREP